MKNQKSNILIINGSIRGTVGNSGEIIKKAISHLQQEKHIATTVLTLTDPISSISSVKHLFKEANGFLIVSGTYWNSWGSPLQRLIEVMSVFENTEVFFGKPVACAISMDSVGGFEVAARLHAVFSGFGCWSPPCSTLVVSRVGLEAVDRTYGRKDDPNEDVWRLDDLQIVINNLIVSTHMNINWKCWANKDLKLKDTAWPVAGVLDLSSPKFI